jgi:hypothetical protein
MKFLIFALLISAIDAFTINCVYVNVYYPSLGITYTCMVHRSLSVTSPNQQVVTNVRGAHLAGRTNNDVRMVNFDDVDDLVVVPRGLTNFFPNIEGLRIYESDVRNLNGNELNEYVNLRWFMVYDSDVINIPGNFFQNNPNLIFVSFDDNEVRQVGAELFSYNHNVTGMQYIGFWENICVDSGASTPEQIESLLNLLASNCSDGSTTTTTTTSLPTETEDPTASTPEETTPPNNEDPTTSVNLVRTRTRSTASISTTLPPQPAVDIQKLLQKILERKFAH